ncbi:hypothetical protein AQUSIP_09340 [Aquicella siphonis]|uniref:DUF1059 domain-containing protein n=1 Tax=Aquicella siphonis TaxID=254247 RepID=A0A5E4PFM9_9COXI|nr:DUF1059 domain-containing protein [Aquicella siphonis]VVC75644.1 hypothetical protein AQUSIP_09340 [Aquicella siphonis]
MKQNELGLKNGKWLIANCGNYPSESNCKVVLMAPDNQREDLLDAVVDHAVKCHGHANNRELRNEISKMLETMIVS